MQKNQIFVLSLQKIMGGHETGGKQNWGAVPPGPGLKPSLPIIKLAVAKHIIFIKMTRKVPN